MLTRFALVAAASPLVLGCAATEQVATVSPTSMASNGAPEVQPDAARPSIVVPAKNTEDSIPPTVIRDAEAAERLLGNSGITLQWIDWEKRGKVRVARENGIITLSGMQTKGDQRLLVIGTVTEIGSDYFLLNGTISIANAPDPGRKCTEGRSDWRFAVTQDRQYWRLRTFEWCDGLTDYIDIYF